MKGSIHFQWTLQIKIRSNTILVAHAWKKSRRKCKVHKVAKKPWQEFETGLTQSKEGLDGVN